MPDGRCEVILYTPDHDATFWSLGVDRVRKVVDLWAERSERLGGREDISYVLVFENRGAEVGATITHPHGQIYAFDFVPEAPLRELERGTPFDDPGERLVATSGGWRAWVPVAPVFPFALLLVPDEQVPDLPTLSDAGRRGLAEILVDALGRLDRMFAAQTPYMLWIHQRPFDGGEWPGARLHVEIVSPWRAPYVPRYIAAGELGSGVYFNPVAPEAAAESLREAAAVSA
jgi:UDPglucose--hexose-1-phosphate uridylyltransferase